jgi:hypothetical protein
LERLKRGKVWKKKEETKIQYGVRKWEGKNAEKWKLKAKDALGVNTGILLKGDLHFLGGGAGAVHYIDFQTQQYRPGYKLDRSLRMKSELQICIMCYKNFHPTF